MTHWNKVNFSLTADLTQPTPPCPNLPRTVRTSHVYLQVEIRQKSLTCPSQLDGQSDVDSRRRNVPRESPGVRSPPAEPVEPSRAPLLSVSPQQEAASSWRLKTEKDYDGFLKTGSGPPSNTSFCCFFWLEETIQVCICPLTRMSPKRVNSLRLFPIPPSAYSVRLPSRLSVVLWPVRVTERNVLLTIRFILLFPSERARSRLLSV